MQIQHIYKLLLIIAITTVVLSCNTAPHNEHISYLTTYQADDYKQLQSVNSREQWGTANVHDPTIIKTDSFYYVYSTDAYYITNNATFNPDSITLGHIQIRKSKNLVNWHFVGWALDTIPAEASKHVKQYTNGVGADGIWAPFILKHGDFYRLYYSVSCFGTNSSYIGLAESHTPEGPWINVGCVVKTTPNSKMNAIDPSVVTNSEGRQWMHYGSFFGGLYCVELNPQTGLTLTDGDEGQLVAARSNQHEKIIEAPEIIYNAEFKKYYLFVSYDPLFTHYNVRVGRSDSPSGPFVDMFENNLADTTNNYPILTHSYKFEGHAGWSGNAHCAVLNDNGKYFMLHQGRLAPDNLLMTMHVREIHWLPSGWPAVSPQRYAGSFNQQIKTQDIMGHWEIITLKDLPDNVQLWQGQIPPGGWNYSEKEFNVSRTFIFNPDGTTNHIDYKHWTLKANYLTLNNITCKVFKGWDWENKKMTVLFTGIDETGSTIWGKKSKFD